MRSLIYLAVAFFAAVAPSSAQVMPFDINLTYNGPTQFQAAFDAAEATWESVITGWADGVNIVDSIAAIDSGREDYDIGDNLISLFITADVAPDDGVGGILGSAGPNQFVNDGNVWLASRGVMNFDSADIANLDAQGQLENVILHEMAHVIGIGTMWDFSFRGQDNDLYVDDTGQYTGANALREYQKEFNNAATFVPVELGGRNPGTANGHWDEAYVVQGTGLPPGDTVLDPDGLTVIDPGNINFGKSRSAALLTGFLDSGADTFISATTLGSFEDLGYTVDYSITAIPEPTSVSLIAMLSISVLCRRRRAC